MCARQPAILYAKRVKCGKRSFASNAALLAAAEPAVGGGRDIKLQGQVHVMWLRRRARFKLLNQAVLVLLLSPTK